MDAEVESVMASSQDQREEELQVITNSLSCKLSCVDSYGQNCYIHTNQGLNNLSVPTQRNPLPETFSDL